mgnify:CR=1 FL=1
MRAVSALDLAIEHAGSATALAAALSAACGQTITVQTVVNWGARRVPAERCPDIEFVTGGRVRCEALRPDVRWRVLRERQAVGAVA